MSKKATVKRVAGKPAEEFDYCVGRPWPDPKDGISVYAYGSEVHHGTMENARGFRKYVNQQTGEENFIYQLVKVPE